MTTHLCRRLQLALAEQTSTGHQLSLTTARSRIAELTSMHQSSEAEIARLRRDNDIFSDRIAELQKQVVIVSLALFLTSSSQVLRMYDNML